MMDLQRTEYEWNDHGSIFILSMDKDGLFQFKDADDKWKEAVTSRGNIILQLGEYNRLLKKKMYINGFDLRYIGSDISVSLYGSVNLRKPTKKLVTLVKLWEALQTGEQM